MGILNKLFGKKEQKSALNIEVENSVLLMNSEQFWQIIERAKEKSGGDYEKEQTELQKELLNLSGKEIIEFDNKYRTLKGQVNNWNFWGAAYIIKGGCSDDTFSDFRGWLIGKGQVVFEKAIDNIESLSKLEDTNDGDWEGLCYVATDAFEKKIGKEMPFGITENLEITGEEWDEDSDDLKKRFPKLWEKFGME